MNHVPWKLPQFRIAAPVGCKWCSVCGKAMNARDQHIRCAKCRGMPNTRAGHFEKICPECKALFIAPDSRRITCSRACQGRYVARKRVEAL